MRMNMTGRGWPQISSVASRLLALASMSLLLANTALDASEDQPGPLPLDIVKPVMDCADLRGTDLTAIGGAGSRITATSETSSNGIAFCSVEGTLAPSIGFRVDLPTESWSQRYMQVGCGGLCGRVSLKIGAADGCQTFADGGFALATTDMGHQGSDTDWGPDPQKRADFAYRSLHLTSQTAKTLIARFYGQAEQFSYFNGCSDGGREALIMAQRFPDEFDGIIAGASAMSFQVQNSLYHGWQARANTGPDGKPVLLAAKLPVLHRAVVAACDGLDGQKDGLLAAPGMCQFDPQSVACEAGATDTTNCLTADEVAAVRKLYDGPRDPATGERLTIGGPQYGSELAWEGVFVPTSADQPIFSSTVAMQAMQHLIFETDPSAGFTLADMQFTRATFDTLKARHPLYDATNPDLSAFADSGGKLILWHGWSDPHISPINTIAYHEAVQRQMGTEKTETFARLYVLPGVNHCSGGEGPSLIDLVTPMMAWVERGEAPDAIITRQDTSGVGNSFGQPDTPSGTATTTEAATDAVSVPARSRPVYPYPLVAEYDGKGDPEEATSYRRGGPLATVTIPAWAGTDFFTPYEPRLR